MNISDKTVATIDYTLKDGAGDVIETTEGDVPLVYLHGVGTILPTLESALAGKQAGDRLELTLSPEDGYGERDNELLEVVDRSQFPDAAELAVGMMFHVPTEEGDVTVTISQIDGDNITIDGNHPLAGETLQFDIVVREVREATTEELEHGHAHGPGGHDH